MFGFLGALIVGLIAGAIAKLLMPGKDPGGCIVTMLLGVAGGMIGQFLKTLIFGGGDKVDGPGIILSIIGAMLLLGIYRLVIGRKKIP
jgi:uncharacterized membrane protein YeaQ/YmgE (transglycosylase-associated protein family)